VSSRALPAFAALAMAACGGGSPPDTGPPPDARLDQANRAGAQAFSMDMPGLAVRMYTTALQRAYERDDASAIADVSYNLALAQMKAGDSNAALVTVRRARLDLERRHAPVPAELFLVQAAAAYRSGDFAAADAAAQDALGRTSGDGDTAPRAWFIRGLVAAQRGNVEGLVQAIGALAPSKQADLQADREELEGRAALLDGRPNQALSLFQRSAANRQQALDYRGMVRALSLAGEAALRSSRPAEAADLMLRAGRSAFLQGDRSTAQSLLKRAEELAQQTSQSHIIEEIARLRKATAER
jgi:hypothetical protein